MPTARAAACLLIGAVLVAGCGDGDRSGAAPGETAEPPVLGQRAGQRPAPDTPLGFPAAATKNTTRIPGADPVADAAAVALAVHPSAGAGERPAAVTLVDQADWAAAISAAQLAGDAVRAPVLLLDGERLPTATAQAVERLRPTGIDALDGVRAIRVGTGVGAPGLADTNLEGSTPAELARAVDALRTRVTGEPSRAVVVAGSDDPAFAMPAAGWAAKSGDPVLWASRDELPAATAAAIRERRRPRIHILGPETAIGARVERQLERLGDVTRSEGPDPVSNAIAFARFRADGFGWGVTDPGHGLVLATPSRPADAAAGSALSASGSYGPLLLTDGGALPDALRDYLLDIRPGYQSDPVRGVYNHAWLMGDATTISVPLQSRIDSLLEIAPVDPTS